MRVRRPVIIPAILSLGVAGSVLAGTLAPVVAASASGASVQTTVAVAQPFIFYHA